MASPNLNMRDPVMYRILHAEHHRTGDTWCIYPMYDWAHGESDSIEGLKPSICTLEFEHHPTGDTWCIYPMYDWAHAESDSIQGITHSICTLESDNHRPLYDWYVKE